MLEKKRHAPIMAGNYADPSIIRIGEDYYMTHSSYKLTPGLVIWHSRDLLNWSRVGAALPHYEGDVWAPDFVAHNGRYYIYYPAGRTNWVVTAPSPAGPWSKPINLGIKGLDQHDRQRYEGETNVVQQGVSFRDTFAGPELGLHWQCEGVEPSARFRSGNHCRGSIRGSKGFPTALYGGS
ncbi:beta-1,4-xylosidase [Actinobacillus pleuropneumoniae]|nr:beta-1,4-xylosidase [Actinobacillus pleuropneumoniae]